MAVADFMSPIGPADQRVLVETNMHPGTPNGSHQVQWRNATSELLAASDYFSGMSLGAPPAPGYGGLLYYMTYNGQAEGINQD